MIPLEIIVERFAVDQVFSASSATIARIGPHEEGFAPICIDGQPNLTKWSLDLALDNAANERARNQTGVSGEPLVVPLVVIYRDFNDLWYRSVGALVYSRRQVTFTAVQQKRFGLKRPLLLNPD